MVGHVWGVGAHGLPARPHDTTAAVYMRVVVASLPQAPLHSCPQLDTPETRPATAIMPCGCGTSCKCGSGACCCGATCTCTACPSKKACACKDGACGSACQCKTSCCCGADCKCSPCPMNLPSDAPSPRLCIITKWPDFDGYGFNLHAEKSKPGQYIGKVDDNSPAETAGLKEDDRIIEVNGVNIANENHKQVVQRIKAKSNETRLLVVDLQTDKYYKHKNIVVRGTQENVIVRSSVREPKAPPTPEPQTQTQTHAAPVLSNGHREEADNRSVSSAASSSAASEASTQPQCPLSTLASTPTHPLASPPPHLPDTIGKVIYPQPRIHPLC
ncbi:Na(+)/H(+) exchange regulatory cofactor NHE-RF2 [Chionoecetes opilio]|uniref:Na(+)/H(+) exchange regulatory cofactor NHE-RF2 n=1 Tax=Chionoecetes opilio TaxID=41210 RepID=A0A8J5CPA0_CHIOP|nr:Na(+)/H(+) exchange regulatory cofactor NHE-RF2 [Chionoecetes opilio]